MSIHNDKEIMESTSQTWIDLHSIISQSTIEFVTDSMSTAIELTSNYTNYTNSTIEPTTITVHTPDVDYEDYKYRPETYIVPIIFGIIFFAGLMGNGMLIAVFVKHRAMRNVPNT